METSGQLHAPVALHPGGTNLLYPFNRRLGGYQTRFGHFGEEKNLLLLLGIEQ
jgi:hypothetical protein